MSTKSTEEGRYTIRINPRVHLEVMAVWDDWIAIGFFLDGALFAIVDEPIGVA